MRKVFALPIGGRRITSSAKKKLERTIRNLHRSLEEAESALIDFEESLRVQLESYSFTSSWRLRLSLPAPVALSLLLRH
jgi:hypothetical protein